jgi:hypothetical protein
MHLCTVFRRQIKKQRETSFRLAQQTVTPPNDHFGQGREEVVGLVKAMGFVVLCYVYLTPAGVSFPCHATKR